MDAVSEKMTGQTTSFTKSAWYVTSTSFSNTNNMRFRLGRVKARVYLEAIIIK